ncbi:hypothetical protein [Corynebacterium sp. HS2168-gen11]|uniref:hypothetical protein n=1 Tax=Corynebacterium sp. HS2168-gen11 TaxID=2974027 RepID=UPI00216B29B3|nr:hypothetical protein [Corynebacterium sp. HS2168-gen11]MCS4535738.1 hypothetical protein [Corynebacterium sp. HS2168-gen11]
MMTNSSKSSNFLIILSGVLVALIIMGAAVFYLAASRPDFLSINFSTTKDKTKTASETSKETSKNSANGSTAYRDTSEYSNFKPGLTDTSKEFAQIVGKAYVEHYKQTGIRDVVLPVYSPEDDQVYDMDCKHFETYVECYGDSKLVYMN